MRYEGREAAPDELEWVVGFAIKEIRLAAINATLDALVRITPRDTGWAAESWVATRETDSINVTGFVGALLKTMDSRDDRAKRVPAVRHVRTQARKKLEGAPLAEDLILFSMTPYMRYLNEGSSDQAPPGFIETAFLGEARKAIQNAS
ncbi:MAG: hypothetical protein DRJ65_19530 [Acidobacteria bacterium]|nr:MAG: hypothetical protein DRJ65_19530 [Acidobacteriota bacterium]